MIIDPDLSGWQPRALGCFECDPDQPDVTCWMCSGTGLCPCSGHVVFDALVVGDRIVATIEAFDDDGPWYANVVDPQGGHQRRAMNDHATAALWAEVASGHRVARPAPCLRPKREVDL